MKYIKIFELFNYTAYDSDFKLIKTDGDLQGFKTIQYEFHIEDDIYECFFLKMEGELKYERLYRKKHGSFGQQVGKSAYKTIAIVSEITINFLKIINPNIIHIDHMNMRDEKYTGDINKRARINRQYLSKVLPKNYTLEYIPNVKGTECYITKN